MNVKICDFLATAAATPALMMALDAMPNQNRLAAAKQLSAIGTRFGFDFPPEDFFSILNVAPTVATEDEWDVLTRHIDMRSTLADDDHAGLMTRIQVIVGRQRIKAHGTPIRMSEERDLACTDA